MGSPPYLRNSVEMPLGIHAWRSIMQLSLERNHDIKALNDLVYDWWYSSGLLNYDEDRNCLEVVLSNTVRDYGVYRDRNWLVRALHTRYKKRLLRLRFYEVSGYQFSDPDRIQAANIENVIVEDGEIVFNSDFPVILRIMAAPPFAVDCGEPEVTETGESGEDQKNQGQSTK